MAGPITWRNVDGPNPASAAAPLLGAQQSINGAFDIFQGILGRQQQLNQSNQNQEQENLKQAFLDALQGAKSPEELAQIQSQLPGMMGGMNAATRAAVRNAPEARLDALRQRQTADQAFNNGQADQAEKPIIDTYGELVSNGAFGNARDFISSSNLRNKSFHLNQVALAERAKLTQGREDLKFGQGQQLTAMEMKLKEAQFAEQQRVAAEAGQVRDIFEQAAAAAQAAEKPPSIKEALAESRRTGKPVPDLAPGTQARPAGDWEQNFGGSDTARADAFFKKLQQSGKYSPALLAANRDKIRESFSTVGLNAQIGQEAAASARARAANEVAFDEMDRDNPYAPGSPNAYRNYEELAKEAPNLINKNDGNTPEEDMAAIQGLLGELSTKGLEVDGQWVTPSANDVRWALRTADGGWFTDGQRAGKVKKLLQERTKQSVFKQALRDGEASAQYRRQQKIREKLNAN